MDPDFIYNGVPVPSCLSSYKISPNPVLCYFPFTPSERTLRWVQTQCDILNAEPYEPIVESIPKNQSTKKRIFAVDPEYWQSSSPGLSDDMYRGVTKHWGFYTSKRRRLGQPHDSYCQQPFRIVLHPMGRPRFRRIPPNRSYLAPLLPSNHQITRPGKPPPTRPQESSYVPRHLPPTYHHSIQPAAPPDISQLVDPQTPPHKSEEIQDVSILNLDADSGVSHKTAKTNPAITSTTAQDQRNIPRERGVRHRLLHPINTDVDIQQEQPRQVFMVPGSDLKFYGQEFVPGQTNNVPTEGEKVPPRRGSNFLEWRKRLRR